MLSFRLSSQGAVTHLLVFVIYFALLFSLLTVEPPTSVAANRQTQAGQQPAKADSPEEVTRQFYHWYFSAHFPEPKRSNMPTFKKYVTQSLLKRATARDVESILFIDAQDIDESWANNFTVSKGTIQGQKATVQVALNGKEMKYNLRVTLRREGGAWKIDDVKGSET
jgi:hypothetical protein